MKTFIKLFLIFAMYIAGNCSFSQTFKVLVLPVDLFAVCQNYYCFDEMSEIVANDVISNFNNTGLVYSQNLSDVRKKINSDAQLKKQVISSLNSYKNSEIVDFVSLKSVAQAFNVNSVLLISSQIENENSGLKRNLWEVLELSSVFQALSNYTLVTNAVLTDNVNDVVMHSCKYKRVLGDRNSRFWAKSSAQAVSQLQKLKSYSVNILSKNISQNIMLRFYPKTMDSSNQKVQKPQDNSFHQNPFEHNTTGIYNRPSENEDIQIDQMFTF